MSPEEFKEQEKNRISNVTIKRGAHNREKTYVDIQKAMLRDISLSLDARGLLAYLLSLPDNWKVHPRHLAEAVGVGKTKIYSLLNQLIDNNYATKTEIRDIKSRFSSVVYEFYEEKIEKVPEIQKQSTVSANRDTGDPYTETRTLKNKEYKEYISLENNTTPTPSFEPPQKQAPSAVAVAPEREFVSERNLSEKEEVPITVHLRLSPEAKEVSKQMIASLMKFSATYREPKSMAKFDKFVRLLIDQQKQDPKTVMAVFNYALADTEERNGFKGWSPVMYAGCPSEKLYKHFVSIDAQMKSRPKDNVDRRTKNMDGTPVQVRHKF